MSPGLPARMSADRASPAGAVSAPRPSLRARAAALRGRRKPELFAYRGRRPDRGPRDLGSGAALAGLAGVVAAALVVRLLIPRGLWLDEAISVYQANLGFGAMIENLRISDRHPPLHHAALWLSVRLFGDGETAVRIPSILAGTLTVPVLYALGRELFDRRTGLVAAAFGAASPLLVWYAQEARMYAFVALFAATAAWAQARVLRDGRPAHWVLLLLATSALVWSHYFGLLLVVAQQLVFVAALVARRRGRRPVMRLALGWIATTAVLAAELVPLLALARGQFESTGAGGEIGVDPGPSGAYAGLGFYAALANGAWALWGFHSNDVTELLAAAWPLGLLLTLVLLGRRLSVPVRLLGFLAFAPVLLLAAISAADPKLFEVRYFMVSVPLLLVLLAGFMTTWAPTPWARRLLVFGALATLLAGLADQQLNREIPRLYDFRGAVAEIEARARPGAVILHEPPDMRYVLAYYAPDVRARPLRAGAPSRRQARQVFVIASFQDDPRYLARTNRIVGKLGSERRLVRRFRRPQTRVWEFE